MFHNNKKKILREKEIIDTLSDSEEIICKPRARGELQFKLHDFLCKIRCKIPTEKPPDSLEPGMIRPKKQQQYSLTRTITTRQSARVLQQLSFPSSEWGIHNASSIRRLKYLIHSHNVQMIAIFEPMVDIQHIDPICTRLGFFLGLEVLLHGREPIMVEQSSSGLIEYWLIMPSWSGLQIVKVLVREGTASLWFERWHDDGLSADFFDSDIPSVAIRDVYSNEEGWNCSLLGLDATMMQQLRDSKIFLFAHSNLPA
ncbi:hypothetical protein ACH5RR_026004 [Cinchona calisaya]|uniref:Uncharacterized protein n=1 Tax=Cinchona calisaya TaxID=153742 RepID=A0ABD2Z5A2_9GENT